MSQVEIDPTLKQLVQERIQQAKSMSEWFEHFDRFIKDPNNGPALRDVLEGLDIQYKGFPEIKEWYDPDTGRRNWEIIVRMIKVYYENQLVYDFDGSDAYWHSADGKVGTFRPNVGDWIGKFEQAKQFCEVLLNQEKQAAIQEKQERKQQQKDRVESDLKARYGL